MVKHLEEGSEYKPGKRTQMWLKLKRDYMAAASTATDGTFLPDTLDLVPIGANWGRGRRQGLLGSLLMACYDPRTERYQTIGKLGSGFSDQQLQDLTECLKPDIMPNIESSVDQFDILARKQAIPQVWLRPTHVWEVRAAQLSSSPIYTAGNGYDTASTGIALRFPRFVRVRPDKRPTEATDTPQVIRMFNVARES